MKIYVASSWRNDFQQEVVRRLRGEHHEVYDFKAASRDPGAPPGGFHWSDIDPEWKSWKPSIFRDALNHPIAKAGFACDMTALMECEVCVLVLPCGRSAHLEAGYAAGAGKKTIVLLSDGEPELMYRMNTVICCTLDEVVDALADPSTLITDY
jgi:hypothetical protein